MYSVEWKSEAEDELATIWLAASDRNAISDAATAVDRIISRTPLKLGESRSSSVYRVVQISLLFVEYNVIEDDKKVIVQHVRI